MSFLFTKSPGTVLARPPSRNTSRQYLPARYNEALCFQPAAVRPSLSHNMEKGFHALKGMAKNLQHYPSSTRTPARHFNQHHATGLPTRRLPPSRKF